MVASSKYKNYILYEMIQKRKLSGDKKSLKNNKKTWIASINKTKRRVMSKESYVELNTPDIERD